MLVFVVDIQCSTMMLFSRWIHSLQLYSQPPSPSYTLCQENCPQLMGSSLLLEFPRRLAWPLHPHLMEGNKWLIQEYLSHTHPSPQEDNCGMLMALHSSILWHQAKDFSHINIWSFCPFPILLPLQVLFKSIPSINQLNKNVKLRLCF